MHGMKVKVGAWVVVVVAVIVSSAAAARADGPAVLDKAPFSATPAELLEAAKAAPADGGIVKLREDVELSIDDAGRATHRMRAVFLVRTPGPVAWSTLAWSWSWSPSYQDRPRVRARVIAPGGAALELDPKLITEGPVVGTPPAATSDRRFLDAELPPLQAGAVVEQEIVVQDREPTLAAGDHFRIDLDKSVLTLGARVVLSAPAARKARLFAHGLPSGAQPVHRIAAGRETWSYTLGAVPAWEGELDVPGDGPAAPYVGLTIAASWSAVAREYRGLVERRLAEGPAALPAELPRTPTIETVRAIAAWLARTIDDTRISLDNGTLAPATPAETIRRGSGGALDRAVLLAALLRRAGLRADLALLGIDRRGRDLDAELPGIRRFGHAIVRAQVGGRDVWIDPAERLLAPGKLPAGVQGRRALVIADDTAGLVLTPGSAAADNPVRQVRTFDLSETGPATRLVEVTREGGVFEAESRRWIRNIPAAMLKEQIAWGTERAYAAKLDRYTTTAPDDLATPFAITIEAVAGRQAVTERTAIVVNLMPWSAFDKVPAWLTADFVPDDARRTDFEWPTPHVAEVEHRLNLPPGYTPPALPADQTTALGSATFVERHRLDGRTLVITFRFDTGKRRVTPSDFALLRRELRAIRERTVRVEIRRTADELVDAGKPKEALAEIERLIRLHPAEAVHHTELALAYLQLGMGGAARRAARKATELEPASADVYAVLGWILRHDTLGRAYGEGHDRAGALAAFAKARQLDPNHLGALEEHAELLKRDERGLSFAPGADLPRAIEALRAVHTIESSETRGLALAEALAYRGDFAEAERVLRAMAPSEARDGWLVAAVAAGAAGPAAGLALAGTLRTGAAREQLLGAAGRTAMQLRRYDAARTLLRALATYKPGPEDAILDRLARHPERASGRDPKELAFEVIRLEVDPDRPPTAFWDAQTAEEVRRVVGHSLPAPMRRMGGDLLEDITRARGEVRVTGGEAAWRVELSGFGFREHFFAALDRGAAKLVGMSRAPQGLGRHVLRLAARGDLATAAQVLDWYLDTAPSSSPVLKLWGPGLPRDRDALSLAAALLAAGTELDRTLPLLMRCSSKLPDARALCDHAAAFALSRAERWRELEAHAAAWSQRGGGFVATRHRITALIGLGRLDEADRVCDDLAAAHPDDRDVAREKPRVAIARGRYAEATRRYDAIVARADATPEDQNNAAWLRLFTESDLPAALDLARKATGPDKARASYGALNTLAAIEAELGDVPAALLDLRWSMANINRTVPGDADWYIQGRIAEQLGLRDDAIAAYRRLKVEPEKNATYYLAKRRLVKLGVP
jgi:tetratricopeptide (TPR) repeat protein